MPKETGFANLTPNQAKELMKEDYQKQPQDAFAGEQRHKQKQQAISKNN